MMERRECIICGKQVKEDPPFPYYSAWPDLEYYLCPHHAGKINAESVERMLRRRLRVGGGKRRSEDEARARLEHERKSLGAYVWTHCYSSAHDSQVRINLLKWFLGEDD